MLARTITGLDIGSYSIKAAELRVGLRSVEFVRFEEALLPQGAPPEEREAATFGFLRDRNLSLEAVVAALPSDRVTQRHLRFPLSDPRRVRQAVPFEVEGELPVPLDSLFLGHEAVLVQPDQTDVLAVLCPRGEVATYLNELRLAGVEPRILEIDGAVLGNLSASLELSDLARIVLDVGHRKTNLVLLVDGKPVLARGIPIAGLAFTEALAADLGVDGETAERFKHENGLFDARTREPVGPRVQAAFQALAREVLRSVHSVAADALQALAPAEAVLVGGSADMPQLASALSDELKLPCRVLEVPAQDSELGALGRAGAARFAQAAALALRGTPSRRITSIDFRQAEFAWATDFSDLRTSLLTSAALAALVLLLWIGSLAAEGAVVGRRVEGLHAAIAALYTQTFPDAPEAPDPFRALEERSRESRELAEHLGVSGDGRSGLDVLREISARIPPTLEVSLTELNVERRSVQARGYAKDFESVDRVRQELTGVEWFEDVRVSDVVTDPRRGGKTFNLTLRLPEGAS